MYFVFLLIPRAIRVGEEGRGGGGGRHCSTSAATGLVVGKSGTRILRWSSFCLCFKGRGREREEEKERTRSCPTFSRPIPLSHLPRRVGGSRKGGEKEGEIGPVCAPSFEGSFFPSFSSAAKEGEKKRKGGDAPPLIYTPRSGRITIATYFFHLAEGEKEKEGEGEATCFLCHVGQQNLFLNGLASTRRRKRGGRREEMFARLLGTGKSLVFVSSSLSRRLQACRPGERKGGKRRGKRKNGGARSNPVGHTTSVRTSASTRTLSHYPGQVTVHEGKKKKKKKGVEQHSMTCGLMTANETWGIRYSYFIAVFQS